MPDGRPDRQRAREVQSGATRAAVLGVSDGLVTNVALILGVAGAQQSSRVVLLAGLASLVAGAVSRGQAVQRHRVLTTSAWWNFPPEPASCTSFGAGMNRTPNFSWYRRSRSTTCAAPSESAYRKGPPRKGGHPRPKTAPTSPSRAERRIPSPRQCAASLTICNTQRSAISPVVGELRLCPWAVRS